MKLKINRSWRKWKDENNDRHAPRVVVGSEEGLAEVRPLALLKIIYQVNLKLKKYQPLN